MTASNLDALTRDALDYYLFPLATKQDMRTDGPMIFSARTGWRSPTRPARPTST